MQELWRVSGLQTYYYTDYGNWTTIKQRQMSWAQNTAWVECFLQKPDKLDGGWA